MSDVSAPVPPTAAYKLHCVADASPEIAVTSESVTAAPLLAEANSAGSSSSSSVDSSGGVGENATSYCYCTLIDTSSSSSSSSGSSDSSSSSSSSKVLYADEQTMAALLAAPVSNAP
jgi:hypothetical protein